MQCREYMNRRGTLRVPRARTTRPYTILRSDVWKRFPAPFVLRG